MKVLIINKFLHPNGGSETYIFKLGACLQQMGNEVQYFGMEHPGRCVGNDAEAYTTDMDFHGGSKLKKLLYPITTVYSAEARRKLRLVLDRFCPDVCHLNNFNYQLTPSIILEICAWRKQSGHPCRIVYTAHDYQLICPNHMCYIPASGTVCEQCLGGHFIQCTKNKCIHGSTAKSVIGSIEAYYWKHRKAYAAVDTMVCCSAFMKEKLDTNPLFAQKTVVLHNFVDAIAPENTAKKGYVLYFGRFSEEKGIRTLLDACRSLPDIPFVFAGDGPLAGLTEGLPNVTNLGFCQGKELETLIREARFSVYPSEWYENCPFSVMESQMYGTPVIGAAIGGIPELIRDGESGELFPSGDADALRDRISGLWHDPAKQEAYCRCCLSLHFDTVETYTEKMLSIYQGKDLI